MEIISGDLEIYRAESPFVFYNGGGFAGGGGGVYHL